MATSQNRALPFLSKPSEATQIHIQRITDGVDKFYLLNSSGPTSFLICGESEAQNESGEAIDSKTIPREKYKVSIGYKNKCSCAQGRGNGTCIHIVFILIKVQRLAPDNPLVWQRSFVDSEVEQILRGQSRPSRKNKTFKFLKRKQDSNAVVNRGTPQRHSRKHLDEDSVCPICQEEFLDCSVETQATNDLGKHTTGTSLGSRSSLHFESLPSGKQTTTSKQCELKLPLRLTLSYCKYGCGNPIHVKCIAMWAEHRRSQGDKEILCPLCRQSWGPDAISRIRCDVWRLSNPEAAIAQDELRCKQSTFACQWCGKQSKSGIKCLQCTNCVACESCQVEVVKQHHKELATSQHTFTQFIIKKRQLTWQPVAFQDNDGDNKLRTLLQTKNLLTVKSSVFPRPIQNVSRVATSSQCNQNPMVRLLISCFPRRMCQGNQIQHCKHCDEEVRDIGLILPCCNDSVMHQKCTELLCMKPRPKCPMNHFIFPGLYPPQDAKQGRKTKPRKTHNLSGGQKNCNHRGLITTASHVPPKHGVSGHTDMLEICTLQTQSLSNNVQSVGLPKVVHITSNANDRSRAGPKTNHVAETGLPNVQNTPATGSPRGKSGKLISSTKGTLRRSMNSLSKHSQPQVRASNQTSSLSVNAFEVRLGSTKGTLRRSMKSLSKHPQPQVRASNQTNTLSVNALEVRLACRNMKFVTPVRPSRHSERSRSENVPSIPSRWSRPNLITKATDKLVTGPVMNVLQ